MPLLILAGCWLCMGVVVSFEEKNTEGEGTEIGLPSAWVLTRKPRTPKIERTNSEFGRSTLNKPTLLQKKGRKPSALKT